MSLGEELYKDIIIAYSQNPYHYGELPEANFTADGMNRSCGDEIHLRLLIEDGILKKIRYTGQGCSICMASTEMMSTYTENREIPEVEELVRKFKTMLTSREDVQFPSPYEELEALKGVKKFPVRVKCATLSWHALEQAIRKYKQENIRENFPED